jgi:hypothetical protein
MLKCGSNGKQRTFLRLKEGGNILSMIKEHTRRSDGNKSKLHARKN